MYTQWNIIQAQKEGNLAICSPMDRPRGHYAKLSKLDIKQITFI